MLEVILLGMGLFAMLRIARVRKLGHDAFPEIERDDFERWKEAQLRADRVFLCATWGVFFVKILLVLLLQGAPADVAVTCGLIMIAAWLLGLTVSAVLGSKAKGFQKALGIKL